MKKIFSLMLAIVFVFSLSACKNNSPSSDPNASTVTQMGNNETSSDTTNSAQDELSDNNQTGDSDFSDFGDTPNSETDWYIDTSTPNESSDNTGMSDSNIQNSQDSSNNGANSNNPSQAHSHNWQEATCKAPKTCSVCKATEGKIGDHKYSDGKCVYCDTPDTSSGENKEEPEGYANYINYRGYNESLSDKKYAGALSNTYKKLSTKKEFNVVYFGGSVTYGYGSEDSDQKGSWRVRVGEWLATTFPKVKINNINRAIGDTGTNLGLFRLSKDVIAQKPDLLFIEFSINDYYEDLDYISSSTQFETIIRTVKEALPQCDIVTILVTDRNEAPAARTTTTETGELKAGELHLQAKAHEYISKNTTYPLFMWVAH